jgi:hypothetical protein
MAWPGTRFSVKRCCACDEPEGGCTIDTDTFDDAALAKWTNTGASVAGGLLLMGAGDSVVLLEEPDLATDGTHQITYAQTASATATLRIFTNRADGNQELFGELAIDGGEGTLRVGTRIGGSDTFISQDITVDDVDADLNERHRLELCWEPGGEQEPLEDTWLSGSQADVTGVDWVTPELAWLPLAIDGGDALYAFSGPGTSTSLIFQNLRVSIPPGSTINGISIGVSARDGDETESTIKVAAIRLLDGSGSEVGDTYSDPNFTAFNPTFSTHGRGGATDDWNAGLTWEDVTSSLFGFFVVLENFDEFERQAEVDSAGVQIWYTTPDRGPGKLTLTYLNSSNSEVQCAIGSTHWTGAGKKLGMSVSAGSWDFTEYTASYHNSARWPGCPECSDCSVECQPCEPDTPAAQQYVIDFPSGPLAGEWVVDFVGRFQQLNPLPPFGLLWDYCEWQYREWNSSSDYTLIVMRIYAGGEVLMNASVRCGADEDDHAGAGYAGDTIPAGEEEGDCQNYMTTAVRESLVTGTCGTFPTTATIAPA